VKIDQYLVELYDRNAMVHFLFGHFVYRLYAKKCVGPVPTYQAAARLELRNANLDL